MTILNTEVVQEFNNPIVTCFLMGMVACIISIFVFGFLNNEELVFGSLVGVVLFAILALVASIITTGYASYNKYEVILSDEYSAKELYEKIMM